MAIRRISQIISIVALIQLSGCKADSENSGSPSSAQRQLTGQSREVAALNALAPESVSKLLRLPPQEIDKALFGKERLDSGRLETFEEQFGRLPNGLPTFQVSERRWYVLMPLSDLDKQPTGDQQMAVSALLHGADDAAAAAVPAVTAGTPKDTKKDLGKIDHVDQQTPVRNQGERGTCTAFAACADLEALLVKNGNDRLKTHLSENLAYFWFMREVGSTPCQDSGIATFRAADYLAKNSVCDEVIWRYITTLDCPKINFPPANVAGSAGWSIKTSVQLPAGTEIDPNGSVDIKDTKTLEDLLAKGHNVVFGCHVAWRNKDLDGLIDVIRGPSGQPIFGSGGHAMLIVGFDTSNQVEKVPYFIVKNSWGNDLGHKGYLHISYDYIRIYAKYGYVTTDIRAMPVQKP
jgi:hypothetical protein